MRIVSSKTTSKVPRSLLTQTLLPYDLTKNQVCVFLKPNIENEPSVSLKQKSKEKGPPTNNFFLQMPICSYYNPSPSPQTNNNSSYKQDKTKTKKSKQKQAKLTPCQVYWHVFKFKTSIRFFNAPLVKTRWIYSAIMSGTW